MPYSRLDSTPGWACKDMNYNVRVKGRSGGDDSSSSEEDEQEESGEDEDQEEDIQTGKRGRRRARRYKEKT